MGSHIAFLKTMHLRSEQICSQSFWDIKQWKSHFVL